MSNHPMSLAIGNQTPGARDGRILPFVTRLLPWLLAVLMLGVYGLTLNHWVSPDSLAQLSRLEGVTWTPSLAGPVTNLITWPFVWLPTTWVPPVVNLFTAVCAALSLALLARSVALLPHDLTTHQPRRQWRSLPPKLLVSRSAWLPPVLAVLVCGLQLNFWQNAITATSEMFNLLLFAHVIRCFLEFNASRNNAWLLQGALVYGLAVANDWVMAVFFPAFFVALIWIKRLFLLNERFLKRLLKHPRSFRLHLLWQIPGCFLAGLLVFLLLPVIAGLSATPHMDFWPALKFSLKLYQNSLTHFPRQLLITSALVSVMPVFLISIRFYHFLAGFNRLNTLLGSLFFQLSYGFFLLVCLWTMFDSPLSPRRLALGMACLPLYFLGALSIGYFIGHFLQISQIQEEAPARRRRRRRFSTTEQRRQQTRRLLHFFKRSLFLGVSLLSAGIPAALVCKNLPVIALKRSDPCGDYTAQLAQALPPDGAVLLGNDSFQLLYLQAALIRSGRQADYLLLDTDAMAQRPDYLDFLKQHNPGFNLQADPFAQPDATTNQMTLVSLLRDLSATRAIYSLHPAPVLEAAADYFYFQPHGLLYQLKRYPENASLAGPVPPELMRDNETFWRTFERQQLSGLAARANPVLPRPPSGLAKRFLNTLRFTPEPDRDTRIVANYYAIALNDWGVELQRAGKFPEAGICFDEALQLSPSSPPARINQTFNADYRANRQEAISRPLETARNLNEYRDWRHVVRFGAVDEPNFCYLLGAIMADKQLLRPALAQFERVRELSPDRLDARLSLARLFVAGRDYTNAMSAADEILALSPTNQTGLVLKAGVCLHLQDYAPAVSLLTQALALNPTNNLALLNRGEAYGGLRQWDAARRDFNAVLQTLTNAYPAYLDLAKLAEQEHNSAAAVTNYQLFLKYAPPATREFAAVQAHLRALQPAAP